MLEVWLSSFISGIDRWRVPTGLASPPARRDQQGWLKDRVEIRLGGGALTGKSGFHENFDFSVTPQPIPLIPDALECSALDLWNENNIFENIMMGWRQGGRWRQATCSENK